MNEVRRPNATRRKATLYLRAGRLILNRVDTTTEGVPFGTDHLVVIDTRVSDERLGELVIDMVTKATSRRRPLQAYDWEAGKRSLLHAARVDSWKSFRQGCRHVSVWAEAGVISFAPARDLGPEGGFESLSDAALTSFADDPAAVGRAARSALRLNDT